MSNEAKIFAGVFQKNNDNGRRRQELVLAFGNAPVFKNEYYILYTIAREYPRLEPNGDFIRLYLQTNRAVLSNSRHIELVNYRIDETDPYIIFVDSCINIFNEVQLQEVSEADFVMAMEMHKMEYINVESIGILEESTIILSEGIEVGRKTLSGYEDMRHHVKTRFVDLDNMLHKADRKGVITFGDEDEDDDVNTGVKLISNFGISKLDEHIGGVYEGDMVSLLAPAKGGKTRISTYVLHNGVVNGVNVVMFPVENGYKGWSALIRARHFNWFYNRGLTDVTQKRIISADMIRKDDMSDEIRELELASWSDLRNNPAYGRITVIDEDFKFDTFLEVIDTAVNEYGAKLICVDYLQLITGGEGDRMNKNERIGETYKKMLQYLKKKKIGGIFPGQLKQSVVGDIQRVNPEELINMELRDSAGESYEVIKTPDVNLALYGTVEDIRNGEMKLLSIPSRNSAPFEPIDLYVDAGSCTFQSIESA